RERSAERSRDRERREEQDGKQVSAPQRPAAVPVRIRGHGDEEENRRGQAQREVGAGFARAPPADEARDTPEEERREEKDAAGRMEEIRERDLPARRLEPKEGALRELLVLGKPLPRGGENPGRAEADRVVHHQCRERGGETGEKENEAAAVASRRRA